MKKIMAVLTVLMCFTSTNAFAQMKEVRGVQTRMVEYQSNEKAYGVDYSRHGFEFKNDNSYPVWVDVELWIYPYNYYDNGYKSVQESVRATKSFTLNAGETYVWKCGDQILGAPGMSSARSLCHEKYYVKYKAYKAE